MEQMTFVSPPEPEWRPKVRDLPSDLRPVNRLREVGPGVLSTADLVACLLQTPDALRQATELLAKFEGLPGLALPCNIMVLAPGAKLGTARQSCRQATAVTEAPDHQRPTAAEDTTDTRPPGEEAPARYATVV